VSFCRGFLNLVSFAYHLYSIGSATEEWRFLSNAEDAANGVYPSVIEFVPTTASSQIHSILRACYDVKVLYEVRRTLKKALTPGLTVVHHDRQIMEIKPAWLLEVAPHFFKPSDMEELTAGDKKMPKAIGASSTKA
jgi:hypothetical protein